MRAFLRSLLASAAVVSVAYFVWWGCFAQNPCLSRLAEATVLEVQLEGGDRGTRLRVGLLDCFEPNANLRVTINGVAQPVPPELSNAIFDVDELIGPDPVDLDVVLADESETWRLSITDYLQERAYAPRATEVAAGDTLTLDWSGAVVPVSVNVELEAGPETYALTPSGDLATLTVDVPADAAAGPATLRLGTELSFEVARCFGPEECFAPPVIDARAVALTITAP